MWENQTVIVKLLMVLGYGAGAAIVLAALLFVTWFTLLLRDGRRMRQRAREAERKEHRLRVEEAEAEIYPQKEFMAPGCPPCKYILRPVDDPKAGRGEGA